MALLLTYIILIHILALFGVIELAARAHDAWICRRNARLDIGRAQDVRDILRRERVVP